jgi:hypothetical protein
MPEDTQTAPPRTRPRPPAASKPVVNHDPEEWLRIVKNAVCANYNDSRDEAHAPELKPEEVYILSYTRILQNWQVVAMAPSIRRLMWEVTFNKYQNVIYINVFQKINSVKVSLPDKVSS